MEGKPVSRPGSGGQTLHARYSTLRQCSGAYLNLQSFRLADYTTQYLFLAFSPDPGRETGFPSIGPAGPWAGVPMEEKPTSQPQSAGWQATLYDYNARRLGEFAPDSACFLPGA